MAAETPRAGPEDPWDWSVDQVVRELCPVQHRPTWCSETDRLPDPKSLENEIRNNDITGEVLLTMFTKDTLRSELHIKSMGQRHAVEKGINYLRSHSSKYETYSPKITMAPPFTPLHSWLHNSGPPYEPPSNGAESIPSAAPQRQSYNDSRFESMLENPRTLPPVTQNAKSFTETPMDEKAPAGETEVPMKRPRHIVPTFVAHLGENFSPSSPRLGEDREDTPEGVKEGKEAMVREFEMFGVRVSDGQRICASRRLKRFLRRSDLSLNPDNGDDNNLVGQGFKDDADADFRYLLSKYPPKADSEDVLKLYGDSGEEDDFDEETWEEIERDAAEYGVKEPSDRVLTLLEVNKVIDEAIETIRSTWQATRLPRVQAKGFRLWKRARREGRVESEIGNAQYWIRRFQQSILKIRQALARETWANESSLRRQCQSLEQTVAQQEEYQYNSSILGRPKAPPCPDRKAIRRKKSTPISLPEGEILLDSESDLSMQDFIEDDRSQPDRTKTKQECEEPRPSTPTIMENDSCLAPGAVHPSKYPFIEANSSTSSTEPNVDSPTLPPASYYEGPGHQKDRPIELISSSDPTTPVRLDTDSGTHKLPAQTEGRQSSTPVRLKLTPPKPVAPTDSPTPGHAIGIDLIPSTVARNDEDCYQTLQEVFASLSAAKKVKILDYVQNCTTTCFHDALRKGLQAILRRQTYVKKVSADHSEAVKLTALMFTSYVLGKNVVELPSVDKAMMKKARSLATSRWHHFLISLKDLINIHQRRQSFKRGKRKFSGTDSRGDSHSSLDSQSFIPQQTPSKRGRRRIKQNPTVTKSQQQAKRRFEEAEQRRAVLDQKFQNLPRNMVDPASHSIGVEEPVIYLDPKIGEKIKGHQVDGVRFMWRELMTDENKQGCLLAHTMGLGKTMQVISLLVTIAQSAQSPDHLIKQQIPPDLSNLNALILCPPSLIDNWFEEILMWRPERGVLGELYKISQRLQRSDRVREIDQWATGGGVLIISYDMFRGLVINKAQAGRGPSARPLSDEDRTRTQDQLLSLPNIIIADEAHKLRNDKSDISVATSRFRSSRRIALTGSPLANNLDEYYVMIDWIAPGYLGTKEEFRSKYSIPISNGLWNESDVYDRRTSLRKLHVLKKTLDPKISRAGIAAIADDLPPKTEFFITMPLTKKQVRAYNLYIGAILGEKKDEHSGNARLWDWLALLSLLCNHPSTFLTKLDDRYYLEENKSRQMKEKKKKRNTTVGTSDVTTDDLEGAGLPSDVDPENISLSPEMIKQQRAIFQPEENFDGLEHPKLSHRSQIVCDIVELAKAAGDKVLLFSHSIPTLNYLQGVIESAGCSTCRIDGSVNVTIRQETVKEFNKSTSRYDVFVISTRAGGLGLNLQGANRVILYDYGFNPAWEEQAIGRAYRLGQKKPVFVYRLRSAGTFEELTYNKTVFKSQLAARVVDKKNPMRHASKAVTDYLFPVREVSQSDLSPVLGKDPLVLDTILRDTKNIREIILTETFQKEEDEFLTPEEVKQANDEFKDEQNKRRGPVVHGRSAIERQNFSSKDWPSHLTKVGERTGQPQTPAVNSLRPLNNMSHLSSQSATLSRPTTDNQLARSVSRPEASGGPQQAESAIWDQPPNPHSLNRVENVLGAIPFPNNPFRSTTSRMSISGAHPQKAVQTTSSPSARAGFDQAMHLDGAAGNRNENLAEKEDESSDYEGCKTQ